MKISIIIPTHNRSDLLKNVIESVLELKDETEFEFVIVDNNSTDDTKLVAESYGGYAKYVFEKCTSFTKARSTGAENATGDILLYLDDDVVVNQGALKNIVKVFSEYPDCGVIAGKILPRYLEQPPQWTLDCQEIFNGWSLLDYPKDSFEGLVKEVTWAAGPMMAIRRTAYIAVGGFPPDTIGVETNKGGNTFNKLYIGPGDYGLCYTIREKGWKVYYSDAISIYHLIPSVRYTVKFWRSRRIGEGYHDAITQREFFKLGKQEADNKRIEFQEFYKIYRDKYLQKITSNQLIPGGVDIDELWALYYKAYLDMDVVLRKHKDLSAYLWQIGLDGVDDSNYETVMKRLPAEFKELVSNGYVYNDLPITSIESYESVFKDFGAALEKMMESTKAERVLAKAYRSVFGTPVKN